MSRQIPSKTPRRSLIEEIVLEGKLFFRLLLDWRVNLLLKLIPVAGLLFVISPFDFPSVLDDLLVLIFSLILFVELCPRQVVEEHRKALRNVVTVEWHEVPDKVVVDGKIRDPDSNREAGDKTEK